MRALAIGGADYVGGLLGRINAARPWAEKIEQKTLSHHLTHLRRAGLVHERRRGRQHWYDLDKTQVLYENSPAGGFSIKVRVRGLPVAVTLEVGGSERKDGAA